MMRELTQEASALGIAQHYEGVIDTLVIDRSDAAQASAISSTGIEPEVTDTVMRGASDRIRLARECVALVRRTKARAA